MKGFILMTVLLLLEIHSLKADGGGTITTHSVLNAAESTEDSGTDGIDTDAEDRSKKKLRSRHKTTTVTPTVLRLDDDFGVVHFVEDDDDPRYNHDFTAGRRRDFPDFLFMKIIAGVIFFLVFCGLAVTYRSMCKRRPSPASVLEETIPALPPESRRGHPNLHLPPPNLFTSQHGFQPKLSSSQQNIFAEQQVPFAPQQMPYQPESNPYYAPQSFDSPQVNPHIPLLKI